MAAITGLGLIGPRTVIASFTDKTEAEPEVVVPAEAITGLGMLGPRKVVALFPDKSEPTVPIVVVPTPRLRVVAIARTNRIIAVPSLQ